MRQQAQLAPRHHRLDLARDRADQESGADPAGVERLVRLGAMRDDPRAERHHARGHVGVVVERHDDRYVGPEDLAAQRELLALDVVDARRTVAALGSTSTMKVQREAVDPPGGFQAVADLVLKEPPRLLGDAPAGGRPGAEDRHGLDRAAGLFYRFEIAAEWAQRTQRRCFSVTRLLSIFSGM